MSHGGPSQTRASSTDPPMNVLGHARHWVWGLTHHHVIKEDIIALNYDRDFNQVIHVHIHLKSYFYTTWFSRKGDFKRFLLLQSLN